ncbi:MAG: CBS domain-containing protein [Rhodospirillales bacterium]|nr:MAG: CBS domain-containing protein [Rhodospirillales bacterium]
MKQEPYIKVAEVMSRDVRTIDSMATVRAAMEKMAAEGVSSLVVDRRDDKDEYGVLVVADIAREVVARNLSFDRVQVYEIMSKPVVSIDSSMDLRYAIRLLVRFGLSRALVLDENRQIDGMVTLRDMVLRYAGTVAGVNGS